MNNDADLLQPRPVDSPSTGPREAGKKLVIFDMDQTIVDVMPVHEEATDRLFQSFFGVHASLIEIDFAGRSLTSNFASLARLKGIPEDQIEEQQEALLRAYEKIFADTIQEPNEYVLPGVLSLLESLSTEGHVLAIYTGNSAAVVRSVLLATGLGQYFLFCVHGNDAEDRAGMVKLAIEKARDMTGIEFRDKDIVVVGDSTRDVQSGKAVGAVTIAVSTGIHSSEQLLDNEPDFLFSDLEESGVFDAIQGSTQV